MSQSYLYLCPHCACLGKCLLKVQEVDEAESVGQKPIIQVEESTPTKPQLEVMDHRLAFGSDDMPGFGFQSSLDRDKLPPHSDPLFPSHSASQSDTLFSGSLLPDYGSDLGMGGLDPTFGAHTGFDGPSAYPLGSETGGSEEDSLLKQTKELTNRPPPEVPPPPRTMISPYNNSWSHSGYSSAAYLPPPPLVSRFLPAVMPIKDSVVTEKLRSEGLSILPVKNLHKDNAGPSLVLVPPENQIIRERCFPSNQTLSQERNNQTSILPTENKNPKNSPYDNTSIARTARTVSRLGQGDKPSPPSKPIVDPSTVDRAIRTTKIEDDSTHITLSYLKAPVDSKSMKTNSEKNSDAYNGDAADRKDEDNDSQNGSGDDDGGNDDAGNESDDGNDAGNGECNSESDDNDPDDGHNVDGNDNSGSDDDGNRDDDNNQSDTKDEDDERQENEDNQSCDEDGDDDDDAAEIARNPDDQNRTNDGGTDDKQSEMEDDLDVDDNAVEDDSGKKDNKEVNPTDVSIANISPIKNSPTGIIKPLKKRDHFFSFNHSLPSQVSNVNLSQMDTSLQDRMEVNVQIKDEQCIIVDNKKRWACNTCDKTYTTKHNLVTHVLGHQGIKPHCCLVCGKFFKQLSHLHTHMLTHTNARPHKCKICQKSFIQISHLKRHMTIHMDNKPHMCDECNRGFAFPSELKTHKERHAALRSAGHDSPNNSPKPLIDPKETVKCEECGKTFMYPSQLRDHKMKHSGVRPYVCKECGMDFMKEHHLKAHEFTHSGAKPFECPVCGRAFNQKANMTRHLLLHDKDRRFSCDKCDKTFSQPQTLKAHQVVHEEVKPFKCEICDKRFGRLHNLQGHMYMHEGNKPYVCFCGSSFTMKGNLHRHQKVKHGMKVPRSESCTAEEAAEILNQIKNSDQTNRRKKAQSDTDCATAEDKNASTSQSTPETQRGRRKSNVPRKKTRMSFDEADYEIFYNDSEDDQEYFDDLNQDQNWSPTGKKRKMISSTKGAPARKKVRTNGSELEDSMDTENSDGNQETKNSTNTDDLSSKKMDLADLIQKKLRRSEEKV